MLMQNWVCFRKLGKNISAIPALGNPVVIREELAFFQQSDYTII